LVKVAVVDSGCANLKNVCKALLYAGVDAFITDQSARLSGAGGIVFPGVGSFSHAASMLREKGLNDALLKCIAAGKPFLGICLGLQLLFSHSEEAGAEPGVLPAGLNAVSGQVKLLPPGLPVPHVGWNRVQPCSPHPLFEGLADGAYFYFTHSYYVLPDDPAHILALAEYGQTFTAAAAKGNLFGVQFHPEISGAAGLRIFSNFGKIIADPGLLQLTQSGAKRQNAGQANYTLPGCAKRPRGERDPLS